MVQPESPGTPLTARASEANAATVATRRPIPNGLWGGEGEDAPPSKSPDIKLVAKTYGHLAQKTAEQTIARAAAARTAARKAL